jgi:hypothetical protein
MLRMLSVNEFAVLVGSTASQQTLQQPTIREPQSLGEAAIALDQYVRGLELVLEKYPQLSNIAYQKLVELQDVMGVTLAALTNLNTNPSPYVLGKQG